MAMKHYLLMIDYTALAAVAAVVREGSFERAAHMLGVTPSAISQRVRGFEDRLGAILIVRGQPCTATERGRELVAHFDRVHLLEADLSPLPGADSRQDRAPATLKVAVNADSLATWFPEAVAAFARETGMLIELTIDDETHTAERLKSGEVLAAVTSDPEPVPGCKTILLGALRYAACASPDYLAEHFTGRLPAKALETAPYMRFNRLDKLQARWARDAHDVALNAPTHWIPSAQGFLDLARSGLAWGLQPVSLAQPHLDAGRLVELPPMTRLDVKLYWTVTRLHAKSLVGLTDAVRRVARDSLIAVTD
jgi:LysR family transcriptional regulator (chromosome initiation inhibitor)